MLKLKHLTLIDTKIYDESEPNSPVDIDVVNDNDLRHARKIEKILVLFWYF